MTGIKVVMWNCSGFLSTSSASEKMDFIRVNFDFDVLILIESHHKDVADISRFCHIYSNTYSVLQTEASDGDPFSGILVLVLVHNRFILLCSFVWTSAQF